MIDESTSNQNSQWEDWKPLVVTIAAYSILAFLIGLSVGSGDRFYSLMFALSLTFAQSQVTGIFATLGPDKYLKRLAITQACNVTFWLSLRGGFFVAGGIRSNGDAFLCFAAIFAATPQIILGFSRLVAGWRLHRPNTERGPAYELKDLFTLTLFAAIVFALLGTHKNQDTQIEMAILFLGLLVGTLVYGLPTLASIFKMEKADSGCAVQLTMVVTFSFLIFLPLLSIGAGAVAVPALMWIGGCALLTWLPLAIMREKGFVLTNGKEVQCLSVLRTDSERIEK